MDVAALDDARSRHPARRKPLHPLSHPPPHLCPWRACNICTNQRYPHVCALVLYHMDQASNCVCPQWTLTPLIGGCGRGRRRRRRRRPPCHLPSPNSNGARKSWMLNSSGESCNTNNKSLAHSSLCQPAGDIVCFGRCLPNASWLRVGIT